MILTAADPPEIVLSYSKDRKELLKSITSISQTDLSNGIEETMKIASASVKASGSIIMISDGAFDYIPSETDNFKFIRAGKEKRYNLGITDFYLREKTLNNSFELYVSITNFSEEKIDYGLNIYKKDFLIESLKDSILKGETKKFLFQFESENEIEIVGELEIRDLLKSDDKASAYIGVNDNKKILLISPGNFFLEKALNSIPGIILEKTDSSDQSILNYSDEYDIVIFDRIPPPRQDNSGRFIFIDVLPSGIRSEYEKIKPDIISVVRKHPVLESVDFSKVTILKTWAPLAGPQIEELVTGGNTGLLYVAETKYLKFVYLPFDLTDSDFPMRASFPILIKNSINWLSDEYNKEDIIQYKTGDNFNIGKADPVFKETVVYFPDKKKTIIKGNLVTKANYTGLYRFEYADEFYFASVNLTDRDESDISSRFPDLSEDEKDERTGEYKFPVISILLLAAIVLLTIEWLVQEDKW